nr:hypothetical protein M3O54_021060 [Xanthomonas nasturtii]
MPLSKTDATRKWMRSGSGTIIPPTLTVRLGAGRLIGKIQQTKCKAQEGLTSEILLLCWRKHITDK